MNTNELLDAVKARYNLPSDYALARDALKMHPNSIRTLRERGLSDERALQIAELLDIPPGEVLASIHAERARTPAVKEAWKKIAESMRTALGIAAMIAVILPLAIPPRTAQAQPGASAAFNISPGNIHYATRRRSWLSRALRRFLRSFYPNPGTLYGGAA